MIGILWYRERAKHPIEYFHTRSVYFYLSVKIQALGFHALGYGNWMFGDSWSCVFFGADSFGCRTFFVLRERMILCQIDYSSNNREKNKSYYDHEKERMSTLSETKRKTKKLLPVIIAVSLLAVIVVAVIIIISTNHSGGEQITKVTTTLEKILEVSDLETAQIFYNAVATKKADDNEKVLYYAAYEGTIKAGIDFSKVNITADKETNTITVTLPKAEVLETKVDPGTIEYIFLDKKTETESVSAEANKLCIADLERRAEEDSEKLLETATENAKKAIEGLFEPWLIQSNNNYSLIIQ